jgi:hypothetical protein
MSLQVTNNRISIETPTLLAEFDGAHLVRLADRSSGTEFINDSEGIDPLELYFRNADVVGAEAGQTCRVQRVSDHVARVIIEGEYSGRELFIRIDASTGDLCVRPSAETVRHALQAVRWKFTFDPDCTFVLPFRGGHVFRADGPHLPQGRTMWPSDWNAQLAIIERDDVAMMVHSEDTQSIFKALTVTKEEDRVGLGFESEAQGPLGENRTAGGVEWRINTYAHGWKGAADRYRDWMEHAYSLESKRRARPDWVRDITLAVSWASSDQAILEPLSRLNPPEQTLIHLDTWRSDPYDVNYPRYEPSEDGRAFATTARGMGFQIMPHYNYFGCCKTNPVYAKVRDWHARDPVKGEPQGWFFYNDEQKIQYKMTYIHAGLARWRRELIDNILLSRDALQTPAAFLDQTYHTWNTDNPPVESMTMAEGLHLLQEEFAWAAPDLVLAGENLTEISFQRQCFAQLHSPGWYHPQPEHADMCHPICSYLWKGHSRYFGYLGVEPENPGLANGITIYRKFDAIPTIICRKNVADDPSLIDPENDAMKLVRAWIEEEGKA